MLKQTHIHFVRHGYVHNPNKILYGRLPRFRLSTQGINQARAAANHCANCSITQIYTSPMLRARQTAAIIAEPHALHVSQSSLLNEILTSYQGHPLTELEKIDWEFYTNVQPPYETPDDIVKRVKAFFTFARKRHPNQEVIGVTHGDIVCYAMIWSLGLPLTGQSKRKIVELGTDGYPATASITTFEFQTDDPDEVPTFTYVKPY
ncbi:MAG: histidine phosphatase family protein [Anaerolineales bacterium]|nr:histidine phosphatase family protein [Anaerolineales bacterium]